MHIKEKKKWKKYICTIHEGCFIQYKDAKVVVSPTIACPILIDRLLALLCRVKLSKNVSSHRNMTCLLGFPRVE